MSLLGGIEVAPLSLAFKVDIKGFQSDMDKVKTEAVTKSKEVAKQMESTIKVGDKMSKLGSTMTKTLTLPIIGAGTAITKMAVDYESSFAKVSTLLDRNVVDYDQYKNDILDASGESKVAVDEFSEAVYSSISAGVDQTKAVQFTTEAMKLAKGGFTDGAKAVDVMTTAINGYSLKSEDASKISDMLITTQNLGKTTVDELAASMGKVIPIASSVNFGMDELSASYAQLTKNGIATAEAGTYLKSMLSEMGKSGSETDKALRELTGKGFADLKKEGKSTSEILNLLDEHAKKNGKTIKDMFGSVEAGSAALVLGRKEGKEYDEMLKAMKGSAGATQEAFDKMDATPAEQLKGALNELKNAGIKLGTKLVPVVTKIADKINDLVDWFNELSPAQQDNILKMGAMVAAAGPLLKVTGNLVSTYGKLKPLVSGLSTYFKGSSTAMESLGTEAAQSGGLMGKLGGQLSKVTGVTKLSAAGVGNMAASLGAVAVPAAGVVTAGLAIATVYKGFTREVIPEVDLFKSKTVANLNEVTGKTEYTTIKISEETQKQIQAYMDLSDSAQQETMQMYTGITKVTDEKIASITGKVDQMASSIVTATNTQRDKVINDYQDMFNNTTVLTKQEQEEIMKSVNKGYDERIKATNELKDRLNGIYQDIADNGGKITDNQRADIDAIYRQMKEQSVQAMAENEAQQNVILNRLSSSNKRVTAEMVGDTIKQMNELRDKSIQSAAERRDALVLQAERLKTLEGDEYKEMADKIIEEANREYEGSVRAAELTRSEGIDKLMSAHKDLAGKISVNTGEIVSDFERTFGCFEKWDGGVKTFMLRFETSGFDRIEQAMATTRQLLSGTHYNGLSYVPYDGYNARLHEGERVLTKKENEVYTKAKQGGPDTKGIVLNVNSPKALNPSETAERIRIMMQELALGV